MTHKEKEKSGEALAAAIAAKVYKAFRIANNEAYKKIPIQTKLNRK